MRLVAPEHIDVLPWFNSLRMSFADYYIPSLLRENDWKYVANYLRSIGSFRGYVPSTEGFSDWREWARAFYSNNVGG